MKTECIIFPNLFYLTKFILQTAQLMSVYIARYCVENIVEVHELTEVIEDLMDEEFETICHDNSPKGNFNTVVLNKSSTFYPNYILSPFALESKVH